MNIFIIGATGRMGEEIRQLISSNRKLKFVGGLAGEANSKRGIVSNLSEAPAKIDVVIDFSNAAIFSEAVQWCVQRKLPLLSGTTGITPADKKRVGLAGKKIPILWAPNTAPGVHWVKKIFSDLGVPEGFKVQITETHHIHKKDKPSGTALLLQNAIATKKKNLPPPVSIRKGNIFGIHRIELKAKDETITIEHEALSRTLFARGALDAAQWLAKKKPGLYTMENFVSSI
jgi:4-hydroxy-tetrahydrodipicolinate reductase